MHYFIGHDCTSPHGRARYLAATGAHIAHMLRDAIEDAGAGYYNIPAEVVNAHHLRPDDAGNPDYQAWVKERVQEARSCFAAGRDYLARVENFRCRMAGYAYIQRFEGVLDAIEAEGYRLRADYPERKRFGSAAHMLASAWWMALSNRPAEAISGSLPAR
ncbi:MAG: hypothetical protein EHM70_23310 [Chloroflexota bacterium]|nr:MAG: hypothetical protein EHM70_23310 [Chloroflexota bacterium]